MSWKGGKDMQLIKETIAYLEDRIGQRLDTIELAEIVVGLFYTGVRLNTNHCGVAFTPRRDIPEAVCCPRSAGRMPEAGNLRGRKVVEILPYASSSNVLKSAIGVATVNALSQYLWQEQGAEDYQILSNRDALEAIELSVVSKIVLVGAFVPFIRQLKTWNRDFIVLERDPQALKGEELKYFRPQTEAREVLSHSEVVIITGAAIVNQTIDQLLSWISPGAQVIVAGPTASMVPLAFFKRGVDCLGGIRIDHPARAMRILSEGGSGYHLFQGVAQKILLVPAKDF